jgi:hypothetical protein
MARCIEAANSMNVSSLGPPMSTTSFFTASLARIARTKEATVVHGDDVHDAVAGTEYRRHGFWRVWIPEQHPCPDIHERTGPDEHPRHATVSHDAFHGMLHAEEVDGAVGGDAPRRDVHPSTGTSRLRGGAKRPVHRLVDAVAARRALADDVVGGAHDLGNARAGAIHRGTIQHVRGEWLGAHGLQGIKLPGITRQGSNAITAGPQSAHDE